MGQKVHSIGFRIPLVRKWDSQWYNPLNYSQLIHQDYQIRYYIQNILNFNKLLGDSPIIKRKLGKLFISLNVFNLAPKKSSLNNLKLKGKFNRKLKGKHKFNFNDLPLTRMKKVLSKLTGSQIIIQVKPTKTIKNIPFFNAPILAKYLAYRFLKRRDKFRNTLKQITSLKTSFIKGIKIVFSGRLKGLGRARTTKFKVGSIPLQTMNAKIDYGFSKPLDKYGISGIKVWICYN